MRVAASRPGVFTPRKRVDGTHRIGGWVGPRAGLDVLDDTNPLPLLEIEPRNVQPVAESAHRLQKLVFLLQYRD